MPPPESPLVTIATLKHLKFVDSQQWHYRTCLGFLPKAALENYIEAGYARIVHENGYPAGMLIGRPQLRWQPLLRPIYQAAVQYDATRRHLGLALVDQLAREAIAAGQIGIQANCAEELEANEFWAAAGFKPICYMSPKTRTGRKIICWRKPLVTRLPMWFAQPPERAGHLARTVHYKTR